jgi:hypothetical protein
MANTDTENEQPTRLLTVTVEGAQVMDIIGPYNVVTTLLPADTVVELYKQLMQKRREAAGNNIQIVRSLNDVIK